MAAPTTVSLTIICRFQNILCTPWLQLFRITNNGTRFSGEGGQHLHLDPIFPCKFHAAIMEHLGAVFDQRQHFFIADALKPHSNREDPGIPILDPVHIRKDLAFLCFQIRRQSHRRGV